MQHLQLLILVDAKNSDSVQLWQFGDQDTQKRGSVDDKVCCVVFCIETCQEVSVKVGKKDSVLEIHCRILVSIK